MNSRQDVFVSQREGEREIQYGILKRGFGRRRYQVPGVSAVLEHGEYIYIYIYIVEVEFCRGNIVSGSSGIVTPRWIDFTRGKLEIECTFRKENFTPAYVSVRSCVIYSLSSKYSCSIARTTH